MFPDYSLFWGRDGFRSSSPLYRKIKSWKELGLGKALTEEGMVHGSATCESQGTLILKGE
jgi:hypothetical protein